MGAALGEARAHWGWGAVAAAAAGGGAVGAGLAWAAGARERARLREQRFAERQGRTRAEIRERELRRLQGGVRGGQGGGGGGDGRGAGGGRGGDQAETSAGEAPLFPALPIGTLRSCFSRRCGTPRQSLLVGEARAELLLRKELPEGLLSGLEEFSHCWVLFCFHENTNLDGCTAGPGGFSSAVKGKIRVPRLDGGKRGALATRTPHRPLPLGLSVARVLKVEGRTVLLGGADILDGTPVLDVKPYVPFCDAVPGARAPPWVGATSADGPEPLQIASVDLPPEAEAELRTCWARLPQRGPRRGLYHGDFAAFVRLVREVLSRDLRSAHKRGSGGGGSGGEVFRVELEGAEVAYTVDAARRVRVRGARPAAPRAPPLSTDSDRPR